MEIIRNNLVMRVLRVITPDEISQMVDSSTVHLVSTLTDQIKEKPELFTNQQMDVQADARVLSFKREQPQSEEFGQEELEQEVESKSVVGSDVVGESDWEWQSKQADPSRPKRKLDFLREENREKPKPKKVNMSIFILSEKAKMAAAQRKLKSVEIHKLYKQNNAIDIEQVKKNRDDLGKSNNIGLLIRKKQS
jgi:hypothetical protein